MWCHASSGALSSAVLPCAPSLARAQIILQRLRAVKCGRSRSAVSQQGRVCGAQGWLPTPGGAVESVSHSVTARKRVRGTGVATHTRGGG